MALNLENFTYFLLTSKVGLHILFSSDRVATVINQCDRGGHKCPLFYYNSTYDKKALLTYEEQVDKLQSEKGLIINDKAHAIAILTQTSYFALINGYKSPFKDAATGKYITGTTFEDIEILYYFDKSLRELFFKYLLEVEQKLKSHISYHFSEKYGGSMDAYTSLYSYDYQNPKKVLEIFKLIGEINRVITTNYNSVGLNHYITNYDNVPLWVLMRKLTFGNVSKMLDLLPVPLQTTISKKYIYLSSTSQLVVIISLFVLFRNTCAHNDRLYNYTTSKVQLPPLKLHKALHIPRLKNGDYIYGKHDLFAVVIALRYLLEDHSYMTFFNQLQKIIDKHIDNRIFSKTALLKSMGFPNNWITIPTLSF